MARFLCTVRGCAKTLRPVDGRLTCVRGHSFDVAASGYINLLGPQDRRSRQPGDSREAAQARRRLADADHELWMLDEVLSELDHLSARTGAAVLDIGCGEGFLLGSLARARRVEAHGIDISVPAVELAARRYPAATWVVGNADRFLPWADGSFDLVTSVTARRNGREIRRVLSPGGRVVVVVPGQDDLIELRQALFGRATRRDRTSSASEELRGSLELISKRPIRRSVHLHAAAVRDLLATTYRGGRFRERAHAEGIGAMQVTMSRDLLLFRR